MASGVLAATGDLLRCGFHATCILEVNVPVLRSELHYDLPPELIAESPAERRDASRLLVLDRRTRRVRHERFTRLPDLLPPRAVLVFNDTRVLPARLELIRPTGGRLEGLFLCEREPGLWELMLTGAGRVKEGEALSLLKPTGSESSQKVQKTFAPAKPAGRGGPALQKLVLVQRNEGGTWQARVDPGGSAIDILSRYGAPPLPPYILKVREAESRKSKIESRQPEVENRPLEKLTQSAGSMPLDDPSEDISLITHHSSLRDVDRYQTVYAAAPGAVAAPTAGLHFTPELLDTLRGRGFETHFVTLHVGVGTFAPIRADDLAHHVMHEEWYQCSQSVADAVNAARAAGRPVVAVGTTSVRVLESRADEHRMVRAGSGWTRLFLYPPCEFKVVDAIITNFHLPESTLLAMVFAFAGRECVLAAYQEAIRERYRFYSYGDAMVIN